MQTPQEMDSEDVEELDVWWWADPALLLLSHDVANVNEQDSRAWRMRAEILCALFGRAPWLRPAEKPKRKPVDYRLAAEAYEKAAGLTADPDWGDRLRFNAQKAEAFAEAPHMRRTHEKNFRWIPKEDCHWLR